MEIQYYLFWNQTLIIGNYNPGLSLESILPELNYQIYGSGFCELPYELGGIKRKRLEEKV